MRDLHDLTNPAMGQLPQQFHQLASASSVDSTMPPMDPGTEATRLPAAQSGSGVIWSHAQVETARPMPSTRLRRRGAGGGSL